MVYGVSDPRNAEDAVIVALSHLHEVIHGTSDSVLYIVIQNLLTGRSE